MSLPRQSEVRARRCAVLAVSAMALLSGVAQATVEYRPGTRIPSNARPYVVPRDAAIEVPAVCLCKYSTVGCRVLVVDPATSDVVAEVVE